VHSDKLEQALRACTDTRFARRWGRHVNTVFLLAVGVDEYLVSLERGEVREFTRGPLLTPSYVFGVRASAETWTEFWSARPAPGRHDLMALLKYGQLSLEGNLHPLMANLFFFKYLLESPRQPKGA
jgi:hypothetical protein